MLVDTLKKVWKSFKGRFQRSKKAPQKEYSPLEGDIRIVRIEMGDGRVFFHIEEYFSDRHKFIDRVQFLQKHYLRESAGWCFNIPNGTRDDRGNWTNNIDKWLRHPAKFSSFEEALEEQMKLSKDRVREETFYYIK